MFAPQQIPQSVREMYERAVFLANRIDCQLTVGALVLIAATATKTATTSVSKPIVPETVDIHEVSETLPVQPDDVVIYNTTTANAGYEPETTTHMCIVASQTPPEPQTGEVAPNEPEKPPFATTGPMDAPQGITTESGRNSLERSLNLMTKAELLAHATDACKMTMKQAIGKEKKGKVTKRDIQYASKATIIKNILGQKNG